MADRTVLDEIAGERRQAFPSQPLGPDGMPSNAPESGISRLDYFAAHAPVSYEMAFAVYGGSEAPHSGTELAVFFAIWAMLRREYAKAMIAEIDGADRAAQEATDATS